jgi:hypothetical protein
MFMKRHGTTPTFVEWLLIAGIASILMAILMPEARWASDGSVQLPVQVFVFDLERRVPIENARVMLIRGEQIRDLTTLAAPSNLFPRQPFDPLPPEYGASTDATGSTTIEHQFHTGASHKHPVTRAFLEQVWVQLEANGYGRVAIPIRHESQPVAVLKKQGPIIVQLGLAASKAR